ncbi:type II toxin-antitoxin system Phd/YefM family antitoxin [Flavobacterium ammonificans]|jgi:antitoxin YefM|uniref:type II toxin-antitoxin system Phd/YefM family antitoxin n=1 Tax=Flavobacterium ammonificans TaxID=1751056 RepID=UPI001E299BFB|nr:type II toxin-antitoxin system prevent-host-death family antitoxin [Flavobacterium ammonificans]BDB55874.1 prevent-host-death protein [Flavobacterium ammonificans]
MKVINYTDLRLNLKKWMDSVTDDMEEIIVKRKDNKDLVLISLEEYNALNETNYLLSGKNRDILLQSVKDIQENKSLVQKELIEE